MKCIVINIVAIKTTDMVFSTKTRAGIALFFFLPIMTFVNAQPTESFYNVIAGNGNGIRFWNSNYFKIHMGNTSEYVYGPVTDYSLKMDMDAAANRGWTWGVTGNTPIAALSNLGELQIANTLFTGGHVGVGTTSVSNLQGFARVLDVRGGAHAKSIVTADDGNYRTGIFTHPEWNGGGGFAGTESNHQFFIVTNLDPKMVVTTSGDVGVGTLTPDSKLSVNGTVHAKEVKVDLVGWPDYVFEKAYSLPSLEKVQSYINQYHHLPDMPSASEVEANGLNLGEMNKLLLKKVEELTLYLIEADRSVKQLEGKGDEQEKRIIALEGLLKKD
jgi:hypothetical protein